MKKSLILALTFALSGCSYANLDDVKSNAPRVWKEAGYQIIGYSGYTMGNHIGPGYGGAAVWFMVTRIPANGITYEGYIQKWGNEYHVYNVRAIDAIKP